MKITALILMAMLCGCSLMPQKAHVPHKVGAPIGSYPNASALQGPEQMIGNQNGVTSTITPTQIGVFVSGTAYTVSTLPTCNSSILYKWAVVTDAVLATQAPGGPITGSSTGILTAFCNGTEWIGKP